MCQCALAVRFPGQEREVAGQRRTRHLGELLGEDPMLCNGRGDAGSERLNRNGGGGGEVKMWGNDEKLG